MQGRILRKYADEIVMSYDSDTAGQRATERGLEILVQLGCRVKVLQTPDGKDPDEYIRRNGAKKFKNLIDRALSLLEYKISLLKKMHPQDNPEGKLAFLNGVADLLSEQDNFLEREMVIKRISQDYDITEDALHAEVERRLRRKDASRKTTSFIRHKMT